jgi:hypothetical protein
VTKYASVSNGSLANATNGLLNTNSLSGVVNGNNGASSNIATNLMRSLLTSSNKTQTRGYFNHLSTNNNNNTSNTSINGATNNSSNNTNNIFVENELSAYSMLPSDSYKGNLNTSLNNTQNTSIITATMPLHQHLVTSRHGNSNSNLNQLTSREKTHAQLANSNNSINSNSNLKSYEKGSISNLRKDNSFYVSTKENQNTNNHSSTNIHNASYVSNSNNSNGNGNMITSTLVKQQQQQQQQQTNFHNMSSNNSQVDTNSILNSFYANPSTISTSSHPNSQPVKARSSKLAQNRSVLSSKQLNNQTPVNHHHHHSNNGSSKADCLTSSGEYFEFLL